MKRAFIVTALAAAIAATTTAALAAAPEFAKTEGAGSADPCTVVPPLGGANFCFPRGRDFAFSAISRGVGPIVRGLGGHANGFYEQHNIGGVGGGFRGDVTCLNVVDNTAVFGGIIRAQANQDVDGVPFVIYVVDNGEASQGDPPDLISPLGVFPQGDPDRPLLPQAFPRVCPPPVPSIYGYLPVTDGNIVVQEGSITVGP